MYGWRRVRGVPLIARVPGGSKRHSLYCTCQVCELPCYGYLAQLRRPEVSVGIRLWRCFPQPGKLQDRNAHSLLRDFEEEIPGYLNNNRIISILERAQLSSGADAVGDNLHRCYEALISAGIIPFEEMPLVEAWLVDFHAGRDRSDLAADSCS